MSCLKLFAPDDCDIETTENYEFADTPDFEPESPIVSWKVAERPGNVSLIEILARSRAVYQNKRCRDCGRPTVEPRERDDAILGKNRAPIPGTATLIGFQCQYCRTEWPL